MRRKGEQRILFGPATWQLFKTLQTSLGEGNGARVSFLDGTIQLMPLSLEHESRKSQLSRLLEVYLYEREVEFFLHGSTTLESEIKNAGKEPDESYCFHRQKKYPDLVIEIAITRGGIDTLELYRRWQIPEVWIWQRDRLQVFDYRDDGYVASTMSRHFPDLNIALLETCARIESVPQARRQFLAGLKKKRRK